MGDQAWILAIIGSTVSWALADLILDVTIGEEPEVPIDKQAAGFSAIVEPEASLEEDEEDAPNTSPGALGEDGSVQLRKGRARKASDLDRSKKLSKQVASTGSTGSITVVTGPQQHMSGDQDTAVAGLVTLVIVYAMCIQRWISHRKLAFDFEQKRLAGDFSQPSSGVGGVWSPFHDHEWWVAAVGGLLLFWHYQTLYWAYDTAPSTVINPLLQVSSTWVLLGTAIPAMITGSSFIQPFDLFCYGIIVIGGLLPSLEGDVKAMLRMSFWRQGFVKNAVLSEISLGLYDLLLSWVIKSGKLEGQGTDGGPNVLENEFFFIAWCWFVVSFAFAYGLHPRLQEEYQALRKISPRILALAGLGQVIMFIGYYSSQFGYSWFYQASVVHAAESSMAQGFNLIAAFIAKRCFNVGRDSAIQGMKYKVISVIIVSVGLFMIAFQDVSAGESGGGGHG